MDLDSSVPTDVEKHVAAGKNSSAHAAALLIRIVLPVDEHHPLNLMVSVGQTVFEILHIPQRNLSLSTQSLFDLQK